MHFQILKIKNSVKALTSKKFFISFRLFLSIKKTKYILIGKRSAEITLGYINMHVSLKNN